MLIREVAQTLQEAGLGGEHTLQRFDDNGGQLVMVGLEDGLGGFQVVEGGDEHQVLDGLGDAAAAGNGLGEFLGDTGPDAHEGVVAGAVVAALELKDFLLAGEGAADSHCLKTGVGAAGGEADLLGAGKGLHQGFGEEYGLVVGGEEGAALLDGLDYGFEDRWVGVAEKHGAGAHEPVNVFVAADVPDPGALSLLDEEPPVRLQGHVAKAAARQELGCLFQELVFQGSALGHGLASRRLT